MKNLNKILLWGGLALPFVLVYQAFFTGSHLVWGDAPYFYQQNLKELFSLPLAWNTRNDNFGSYQGLWLWLYLPTFLYGLLNQITPLNNDLLIRLIFYFPATLLAITGSSYFLRHYSQSRWSTFFGCLFYSFNSYFLLLIDGGQIGVALAYGLFPWVVGLCLNFIEHKRFSSYLTGFISLFVLSNVDVRLTILALTLVVLLKPKISYKLIWLVMPLLLVNSFWLLPLVSTFGSVVKISANINQEFNTTTLTDSLLIFQSHFPLNEFGHTFLPPFYYVLLPLLLVISVVFKKKLSYLLGLFLVLAFLAKGSNPPVGQIFDFLTSLPLGFAFRDSTKFYFMLTLIAAILLVNFVDLIIKFCPKKQLIIGLGLLYLYLLILIYPALENGLSGTLNKNVSTDDQYTKVYRILADSNWSRSLWFPEKPPLAFSSWQVPAISADSLYLEHPLASMIDGTYDLYGYLNNPQLTPWLRLIGARYLFFPENDRKKTWTVQDKVERQEFVNFVDNTFTNQHKLDLPYPAFDLSQVDPNIFSTPKIYFILGGDEIYNQLFSQDPNFNLANQGFVFLEDPRINISQLNLIQPSDAQILVLGDKSLDDLAMVYLKNKIIPSKSVTYNQWGSNSSDQYLSWKNELLKGGVRNYDYTNQSDVDFSSIKGEKIVYKVANLSDTSYYLAIHSIAASGSAGLNLQVSNYSQIINVKSSTQFTWQLIGPYHLSGDNQLIVTNQGGFQAINGLAIVDQSSLQPAEQKSQTLFNYFSAQFVHGPADLTSLTTNPPSFSSVDYRQFNPTEYQIQPLQSNHWLIMTDHFDLGWSTDSSINLPVYGMFNAFYVSDQMNSQVLNLKYQPQKLVTTGLGISFTSALILLLASIGYYFKVRR